MIYCLFFGTIFKEINARHYKNKSPYKLILPIMNTYDMHNNSMTFNYSRRGPIAQLVRAYG